MFAFQPIELIIVYVEVKLEVLTRPMSVLHKCRLKIYYKVHSLHLIFALAPIFLVPNSLPMKSEAARFIVPIPTRGPANVPRRVLRVDVVIVSDVHVKPVTAAPAVIVFSVLL